MCSPFHASRCRQEFMIMPTGASSFAEAMRVSGRAAALL
jgi:enolase